MICLVRKCWPPTGAIINFNDSDEAVILVLDAVAAVKIANDQWEAEENYPKRLSTNRATLTHTGELWIPLMHVDWTGTPEFSDGRHRTLILQSLGYKTVPVLASRKTADALEPLWGRVNVAHDEYQFLDRENMAFVGR